MTYKNAKKLHNGDQVTIKGTGNTVSVITCWDAPELKYVMIEIVDPELGYAVLTHKQVT